MRRWLLFMILSVLNLHLLWFLKLSTRLWKMWLRKFIMWSRIIFQRWPLSMNFLILRALRFSGSLLLAHIISLRSLTWPFHEQCILSISECMCRDLCRRSYVISKFIDMFPFSATLLAPFFFFLFFMIILLFIS